MEITDEFINSLHPKTLSDQVSVYSLQLIKEGRDPREILAAFLTVTGDMIGTLFKEEDETEILSLCIKLMRMRAFSARQITSKEETMQ